MDTRNDQPIPAGETAETTPSRRQTLALMLGAASRPALLAPERAAGIGVHDAPAMPLGCGLRRSEAAARTMGYVERRYGRWCVVEGARAPARRVTCGLPPGGGRGDGHSAGGVGGARLQQALGLGHPCAWRARAVHEGPLLHSAASPIGSSPPSARYW